MAESKVETYKGFYISPVDGDAIWETNKVSGHSYIIGYKPGAKNRHSVGGDGIGRFYGSLKACREHVDFELKHPLKIPVSQREYDKSLRLGLPINANRYDISKVVI